MNNHFQHLTKCLLPTFTVATIGFAAFGGVTVYWTKHDPDTVYDYNTPENWDNHIGPGEGDYAYIGKTAGQVSRVRLSSDLSAVNGLYISPIDGVSTTNYVEVTEGAVTSVNSTRLCVNKDGGRIANSYAELLINGGTANNLWVMPANGSMAKITMNSGRINASTYSQWGFGDPSFPLSRSDVIINGGYMYLPHYGSFHPNSSFTLTGGIVDTLGYFDIECTNGVKISGGVLNAGMLVGNLATKHYDDIGFLVTGENTIITNNHYHAQFYSGYFTFDNCKEYYSINKGFKLITKTAAGSHVLLNKGKYDFSSISFEAAGPDCPSELIISNADVRLRYDISFSQPTRVPQRLQISGGSLYLGREFSIDNACTNGPEMRIIGTPVVYYNRMPKGVIRSGSTNVLHTSFFIDHRGLRPIDVTYDLHVREHETLHPFGGFQLVTNDTFSMYRAGSDFDIDNAGCANPDANLWDVGNEYFKSDNKYHWRAKLQPGAEIANGFKDAQGVPFGYFSVPAAHTSGVHRVSVRMKIEPQGENTLADVIAEMGRDGYAVKEDTSGGYNVRVDLPIDRLGDHESNRKVLFDFTCDKTPWDVRHGVVTTNALVTAFGYERLTGFMLIVK